MSEEKTHPKLLELAPPELVVPLKVTHAGQTYRLRHCLRPPSTANWFAYESALEMGVEELPSASDAEEPCYRLQVRSTDAALLLWDRLALRVEGYDLPSGHDFSEQSGDPASSAGSRGEKAKGEEGVSTPEGSSAWRALIPLAHKEAAVSALTLVAPAAGASPDSAGEYFPLQVEERAVQLEAVVCGRAYPRLLHRFRPPSVEAERAYRRLLSETLLVRGSRNPRTLLPARLPALVRLYDQLILGVEGYAVCGQPLVEPAEIARRMDAWHKRLAVQALFGESAATAGDDALAPEPRA